jgi:DNA-binding IclR family transcriptional regulator
MLHQRAVAMSKTPPSPDKLGTVVRAAALLKVVAEQPGDFTVAQVASKLKLPASSTHRLLHLLISQDLVAPSSTPHRYTIGVALYRMSALISQRMQLSEVAAPYLRAVTETCGETCLLGVYLPQQRQMMFAATESGSHPLQYVVRLHEQLPVYWGASGQAIMAWLPDAEIRQICAEAAASPTSGSAPFAEDVMAERLALIRERGYGFTKGEKLPDAVGLAAPIFGADRAVIGDLCITLPRTRFSDDQEAELAAVLVDQAAQLSHALGGDIGKTK